MKIINTVLSMFIFINFLNAEEPSDVLRDLGATDFFNLNQSQISDLPYAEYYEELPREIFVTLTNNKDLSEYEGKQLYVGYGLYDRDNSNYCKYLPLSMLYPEGATVPLLEEEFYNFTRKGEHTYAMSKFSTTYEGCIALADKYGGYPVVIEDEAENRWIQKMTKVPEQTDGSDPVLTELTYDEFNTYVAGLSGDTTEHFEVVQIDSNTGNYIIKEFSKNSVNPLSIQGVWLGMHRTDSNCDNEFTYQVKFPSDYDNWSLDEPNCQNNDQVAVILDPFGMNINGETYYKGKWKDVSKNAQFHCLMEVDSPDIKNPYKVCAPWWRVDREYPNPTTAEEMMGFDFRKYDKSTLPKNIRVCSKYDVDPTPPEDVIKREVSCSSYYYMKKYEHCLNDPYREVCKVNECDGYVADTCDLEYTLQIEPPMKNYVKEVVLLNGVATEVKMKDNIITYIYKCPPAAVGPKNCIEYSDFLIYPATCSNGAEIYGTKTKYFGMDGHPDSPGRTGELDVANSFKGNCPTE